LSGEMSPSGVGYRVLNILGMSSMSSNPLGVVIGTAADLINGIWYLAEGEYQKALWCGIDLIPYIGDGLKKGSKAFKSSRIGTKIVSYGGKGIDYGKRIGRSIAENASLARNSLKSNKKIKEAKAVADGKTKQYIKVNLQLFAEKGTSDIIGKAHLKKVKCLKLHLLQKRE